MTQRELVLACLAASKKHSLEPVQVQKLIFLFQENAGKNFSATPFKFRPYDYGPFDPDIYSCLEKLSNDGQVEIHGKPFERQRSYSLSDSGISVAQIEFEKIPAPFKNYLARLAEWVQSLTFAQLVGAVYKAFPAMRENSVFQD